MRSTLLSAATLLVACQTPNPALDLDLEPPRILDVDLPDDPLAPTRTITIRFSEPLAAETVALDSVFIVPHTLGPACSVDLACTSGRCHAGRCQSDPVDDAWLTDADHPPLGERRRARLCPVRQSLDGDRLLLEPLAPLGSRQLHTLVVTRQLRDRAGNPLPADARHPRAALLRRFATAAGDSGRPTMTLTSPTPGATDLPINLARLVVRFSRDVVGVRSDTVWLQGGGRRWPLRVRADARRCGGAVGCYLLAPAGELPPLTELSLRASEQIHDLDGRPLLAELAPRIATGRDRDDRAPRATLLTGQRADGCLLVRALTDEPTDALLWASWSEQLATSTALELHELALPMAPSAGGLARLRVNDLADNAVELALGPLAPDARPPIAITEVLANPRGPEPAQEFVELRNLGAQPVSLAGWTLDDDDDGVGINALPDVLLAPGQRAVVVGPRFNPASGADPAPAEQALLVRLTRTLGAFGLANAGERIVLRDADRALISSYGGHPMQSEGPGPGVSVERIDEGGCDVAGNWRRNALASSTPGW